MAGTTHSIVDGAVAAELADRLRSELPYQDEIAMRGCIEAMLRRRGLAVADPWATFVELMLRAAHKVEPQVVRQRMAEVSREMRATSKVWT